MANRDTLLGCEVDDYLIADLLGRGGMGAVYRAVHKPLNRTVAFKVLRADLARDPTFRDRLLLEARTAARVEHPNVVPVYDAGEADNLLYLVMQLVAGGDLAAYVEGRLLATAEVLEIGLAVAGALQAAWDHGIVHLDIKPSNILRAKDGVWKVADFGLARQVQGQVEPDSRDGSDTDSVAGSPPYMALEQWEGETPDVRTDLYALGVTLYELLSGLHPLEIAVGAGHFAFYDRLKNFGPRAIGKVAPDVPAPLRELVDQLISPDPQGRPSSATAVVEVLEELLADARAARRSAARKRPAASSPRAVSETQTIAPPAPAAEPASASPSGTSRSAPLRGREAERSLLQTQLDQLARSKRGGAVLLRGPRGIGRTRLLREAAALATRSGLAAIAGRARPRQPLSAARDLLRSLMAIEAGGDSITDVHTRIGLARFERRALDRLLARLPEGIAQARAVLEPLLDDYGAAPPEGAQLPARALGDLVARHASAERPLVVLIDGLEHACRATLDMAASVVEAAPQGALLFVGAALDGPAGDEAAHQITQSGAAATLRLDRLADHHIRAIAADLLGVPEEVSQQPIFESISGMARGLPKIAVATVRNGLRLGRLQVHEGSAIGDPRSVARLAAKVAEHLEATTGERDRSRAKSRPPAGAGPRKRWLQRRLTQGLRMRAFHDHGGAIEALESALDALPPAYANEPTALELRLQLARTLRSAGERLEEACGHAERVAEAAGSEPDLRSEAQLLPVQAQVERGLCLYLLRRYAPALQTLDEAAAAIAGLDDEDPVRRLRMEIAHGRGLLLARLDTDVDQRAAAAAFAEGFRLAAALGDTGEFARLAQSAGEMRRRLSDLDGAERLLRLAVRYKESRGDLSGMAVAYGGMGRLMRERGQREEALRWFRRDLELSWRIGDWRGACVCGNSIGELEEERSLEQGDEAARKRASAAYTRARDAANRTANRLDLAITAFYHGRFLTRCFQGARRDAGVAELEESLRMFRASGHETEAAKVEAALASARSA